jgi:hypothetical protein
MNITFDVKCIRADPQAGICEQMVSGGGMSTCVCEVGTYVPQLSFPPQIPNNVVIGAATENNSLSQSVITSPTGFYKIVNDWVEVTILVPDVDYLVEPYDAALNIVRRTGFVSFSLPPVGVVSSPPVGIANWLGAVFNPSNPGQASSAVSPAPAAPFARRICVPGTVLAAGGSLTADATIGSFDNSDVGANVFTPDRYQRGVLVIKCAYFRV